MLLAFPKAQILRFDESGMGEGSYDELENVRMMREFLQIQDADVERLFNV
jgi:predicted ATPase